MQTLLEQVATLPVVLPNIPVNEYLAKHIRSHRVLKNHIRHSKATVNGKTYDQLLQELGPYNKMAGRALHRRINAAIDARWPALAAV